MNLDIAFIKIGQFFVQTTEIGYCEKQFKLIEQNLLRMD